VEQRLQCLECQKVRYRVDSQDTLSIPVPAVEKPPAPAVAGGDPPKVEYEPVEFGQCLESIFEPEVLEYGCPSCGKNVAAQKQQRLSTFPDVLVVHAKKFQLVNWVPVKLDVPVILPPDNLLVMDKYLGHGKQEGEVELEDTAAAPAVSLPPFNEMALDQLQAMGFSSNASQRALLATGNSDAELAMAWLFEHMEDPDLNDPPVAPTAAGGSEPSADQIAGLADMGFTPMQAKKALKETNGDMERAVEWLFNHPDDNGEDTTPGPAATTSPGGSSSLPARYSLKAFISHKGPSVHSGHYVAHIFTDQGWVLFNDEKVVKANDESVKELMSLAYLYVFTKSQE